MNEIRVFNNEDLGLQVKTVLNEDGSISFNAEDTAIGFGWYEEKGDKLYPRWRTLNGYLNEIGFSQDVAKDDFIPESLYYLLGMKASNERAKKYQRWLAIDVLPSVRKHGAYITDNKIEEILSDPDTIITLAGRIKEERAKNKELADVIEKKDQLIGELQPKADYVDYILSATGTVTATQIAADYNITARQLNKILKEERIQRYVGKQWILYKEHMDKGYAKSETIEIVRTGGIPDTKMHTKWTQKGRLMINEVLNARGIYANMDIAGKN